MDGKDHYKHRILFGGQHEKKNKAWEKIIPNTTSNMPSSDSSNYLSRPWLRVINSIHKNSSTADDSFRKVSNSVSKELTIA